jgi:4-amino-4-deoxy-L-arabinose transferase-like glycosyltransferase
VRGSFGNPGWAARATAGAGLVLFLVTGLLGLGRLPKIHQDEPLIAAPGWYLVTEGRFAFPPSAGYAGSERHAFGFMPLHSALVGGVFRATGPGLFAARLVSLAVALAVLALTWFLGARLLSPGAGAVAVLLLALAPLQATVAHLKLGVPLADLARLVRYDLTAGFFGLAALSVLAPSLELRAAPAPRVFGAAGALLGLAALAHPNGLLFVPALLAAARLSYGRAVWRAASLPLAAGLAACLVPWAIWVARALPDWLVQNLPYSERFQLFRPGFYASNLVHEVDRYALVLSAARARPTPWLFAAALAAGIVFLARRRNDGRDGSGLVLLVPAFVYALFLGLLSRSKNVLYLAPLWPLAALLAAAGAVEAWRRLRGGGRAALVLAALVVLADAGARGAAFVAEARATTPYADFTRRLADAIPARTRAMGMPEWWLGLVALRPDYVTIPFHWTRPEFTPSPVPFAGAADTLAPGVFLLDATVRDLLRDQRPPDAPFHPLAEEVEAWLAARTSPLATVEDPSYGAVEVRAVSPPGGSASTATAR